MGQQTPEAWDGEAATFDASPDHGLGDPGVCAAWRSLLGRLLPPAPARVADLGCGTGTLALLAAELGHAVDGVDFSRRMLDLARAKAAAAPGVRFVLGDAAAPPLPPASYDVVLGRHVLWALPDPAAALASWRTLLRPGGRLVLVEGWWSTGAGLTGEQVERLLEALGLVPTLEVLDDPAYWGRPVTDERFVVTARELR